MRNRPDLHECLRFDRVVPADLLHFVYRGWRRVLGIM
jgi:hypothetical protein